MAALLIIFSTLITLVFLYLRYKYSYWELKGIKQLETHFLFGNFFKLSSLHHGNIMQEAYTAFKGQAKLAGAYMFTNPIAIVLDLDLAKAILIKDFNKFIDRCAYHNESGDYLSNNLFSTYGEKWRQMRTKLTPTFTSGKIKCMFPTIVSMANKLDLAFAETLQKSPNGVVELHDIMGRYSTDVIGTCAFGLECNSLQQSNVEFVRMGYRFFYPGKFNVKWRLFKLEYSNILKWFGYKRFPKVIEDFFKNVVRDTVKMREEQNIQRNDFINILMELKNSKDGKDGGLTLEELAAQVFIFFVAGFETSSSNMSYGLFELAKNPQVQERVREEILQVLERYDGVLTYEAMMEMRFLDQMITETLRKYPALAALTRVAGEDYKIPDSNYIIEKGTTVYIPIREIHHDPEIYENPDEFNPDRFSPEAIRTRHQQAFLGFGDGPRNCIGLRFGLMQVRIGFITLLKSYKFSLSEKTPNELEISNYTFVMVPAAGVWVKVEKL